MAHLSGCKLTSWPEMDRFDAELEKAARYGSALPAPQTEADTREWIIRPILLSIGNEHHEIKSQAYDGKGSYPDYTMLDGQAAAWYLEAKAWNVELSPSHVDQALNYAHANGKRWVVLSNGRAWELYDDRITGVSSDRLSARASLDDPAGLRSLLRALSRESVLSGATATYAEGQRRRMVLCAQIEDPGSPIVKAIVKTAKAHLKVAVTPAQAVEFFRGHRLPTDTPSHPASQDSPVPAGPALAALHSDAAAQASPGDTMYLLTAVRNYRGLKAEQIVRQLVEAGWYVFTDYAIGQKQLKPGDRLCIYVTGKGVACDVTVDSAPELGHVPGVVLDEKYRWRLRVRDARYYFQSPIKVTPELRLRLDAFKGMDPTEDSWAWLVAGRRKLTAHDFAVLTGRDPA
jgi:hypothetical protein